MQTESRISDGGGAEFLPWELEQELLSLAPNEVRLSRGFLCCDPVQFFPGIAKHWAPFFHALGVEISFGKMEKSLYFPPDLQRIVVCDSSGESAVIGMDEHTVAVLSMQVGGKISDLAADVVIEYLERRFLTSLTKTWRGSQNLAFRYLSSEWADEVEVIGALQLDVFIGEEPVAFWFGLGPRLTDEFDVQWRANFRRQSKNEDADVYSDSVHVVTLELAHLSVPPAMLIDYMRTGTVIDVDLPLSHSVIISIDGVPWAAGTLCQLNGMFAVKIAELQPPEQKHIDGTTRVCIELARTELDESSLQEYSQIGAVLSTSRPVKPIATLVINGESVATALVGRLDEKLALSVLSR